MEVWTNTSCAGHYPVGFAAVVVAETKDRAAELLNDTKEKQGLSRDAEAKDFLRIPVHREYADILVNGDY